MGLRNELKTLETKVHELEQDILIIRKSGESTLAEAEKEADALRVDLRKAQELYRAALAEGTEKDRQIHDLKLSVERQGVKMIEETKKSRNLEDKVSLLEDQLRARTPILMQSGNWEVPERLNDPDTDKIEELDGMIKRYRTDFMTRKYA